MIRVCITMYDHTGHRKTTGGDILKLYMCNQSQWSTRRGTVVDHNNGTYTGEVEAAWSGQSELVARLEYTREAISAMYRVRHEVKYVHLNQIHVECEYARPVHMFVQLCLL